MKETISAPGKKPITFQKGGLHESLGVAKGKKTPRVKIKRVLAGKYGLKAKRQVQFAQNVLTGPK